MNFNRDIINHISGKTIERAINGAKELTEKLGDELAPGTSKDISRGVQAEDAIGRASFAMMRKPSQYELGNKFDNILKKLGFNKEVEFYDSDNLRKACTTNGEFDERFISMAEEFVELGAKKPEGQKFCWEGYISTLINLTKNKDGEINEEIYSAIKTLLSDDKISTRGIDNIIKGCTELISEGGSYRSEFNKRAFEKYKSFMDINGKTMHEQDDVFTLYAGEAFDVATQKSTWLREGEDYIFDEVAFNFAKRLYEQGEDIIHMSNFLKCFNKYTKGKTRDVCSGFRFEASNPNDSRWAQKLISKLKESINNEDLIEACKVDGQDSLHNLLVADTLIRDGRQSKFLMKYLINDLKDSEGYARTDITSRILRKEGELSGTEHYDILKCLNGNGSVNGQIYRKVLAKKINAGDIDKCRVNGDINFDNVSILEKISAKQGDDRYQDYQIREVFEKLRNKDGVVEESMIGLVDEFKKHTHLAVDIVSDCMTADRVIDRELLQFKRELCKRGFAQQAKALCEYCKNADGTANSQGIESVKQLLNSGVESDFFVNGLLKHFKTKEGIDLEALKLFGEEYAKTDPQYRNSILWQLINYSDNKFSVEKFMKLKSAMSNPEIAPLMKDYGSAKIVNTVVEPIALTRPKFEGGSDSQFLYTLSHIGEKEVGILEKNGYPARFYKEAGKVHKYSIDTPTENVKRFETSFVKGSSLEKKLSETALDGGVTLTYTREQLLIDIERELEKAPEDMRYTLERAFRIERGEHGIEGFPQRFSDDTVLPPGIEKEFKAINELINNFHSSDIQTNNPELKKIYDEILSAFPEFRMIIGKTDAQGERVDIKTLEQLKKLTQSPEYETLTERDKSVSKMAILLNSLEHVDSKEANIKKVFHTDNDGIMLDINAQWSKKGEYANTVLDRYNLSEQEKYRIVQLLEDIGWAKKLEAGELTPFDIAINQRYKGDEVVSPLIEKVITGECKYDAGAVTKEAREIHKNQQLFIPTKMEELEPYIETKIINGRELKYVDLDRPELKGKPFLAHFLGYDGLDHTLNFMRNKAYRSAFSASMIQGGAESSCFAGRSTGIVFDFDSVNIANMHYTNIESGFGKVYSHLKESMQTGGAKRIKHYMKEELHLNDDEYGELMEKIIHSESDAEITDCIINGKKITKDQILKAKRLGIQEILDYKGQNESTILNPRPVATIGIGESIEDYFVKDAVDMAQSNDMVLLFNRKHRE